jgi:hypothetical protein
VLRPLRRFIKRRFEAFGRSVQAVIGDRVQIKTITHWGNNTTVDPDHKLKTGPR